MVPQRHATPHDDTASKPRPTVETATIVDRATPVVERRGVRLQEVSDGRVYWSVGRRVFLKRDGDVEFLGRLPLPSSWNDRLTYYALTASPWRQAVAQLLGSVTTVNIWSLSPTVLVATVGPAVFVSQNAGERWQHVRGLPGSSGPMGVLPTALCSRDGTVYLGEYPQDSNATPRILRSTDAGREWSTVVELPDVRHVHAIQRDPYTDDLWVTTGDRDAESRINRLRSDGELDVVGGGSQRWRAVELAFTPDAVLWGMDCGYADAKWIFRLDRDDVDAEVSTPTAVCRVPSAVYYSTQLDVDAERWVLFSTGTGTKPDSTGPAAQPEPDGRAVVVAASSASAYTDWYELGAFRRGACLANLLPSRVVPRANTYVFLESDPEQGVLVNPFNSDSNQDAVYRLSPEQIKRIPEKTAGVTPHDTR